MLCKEIIEVIERTYPKQAAMEWDNVGLLVGRTDKEVKKVLVALDLTDDVLAEAIDSEIDMIVTHHPLIFAPLKKITNEHFIGNRVVKLLQHDISYYAMHTNYDVLGMAQLAGDIFGLDSTEALDVTDLENGEGIGRIGDLENKITLKDCCKQVKERFALDAVKVFGDMEHEIKRVAISPGSGKSMLKAALIKHADVLITGDIDHHEGIDAVAQGTAIIDAGHYGLEHIFIKDMTEYLRDNLSEVEVEKVAISHPFQII